MSEDLKYYNVLANELTHCGSLFRLLKIPSERQKIIKCFSVSGHCYTESIHIIRMKVNWINSIASGFFLTSMNIETGFNVQHPQRTINGCCRKIHFIHTTPFLQKRQNNAEKKYQSGFDDHT